MSEHAVPRGSIVVGVDGSEGSEFALAWAVQEADRRGLPLHLVHAATYEYPWTNAAIGVPLLPLQEVAAAVLDESLAAVTSQAPELVVTTTQARGSAAAALVDASMVADTVVVGGRGLGPVRSAVLGSVSQQLVVHARCPAVVVRRAPHSRGRHEAPVVVGVDGSEVSRAAVEYAFAQASARKSELVAVHSWWWENLQGVTSSQPWSGDWSEISDQEARLLSESLAGQSERYPEVPVRQRVTRGRPVEAILEAADGAQLIVVGRRGRGGFAGLLLGSVSQALAQHATGPVAVVGNPRD